MTENASLILSGWLKPVDHLAPIRSALGPGCLAAKRPTYDPVFSFLWLAGTWTEMGYFANAERAKQASDVGRWIELDDGCWRSEDGRRLIEPERVIARRQNLAPSPRT